MSQDKATRKTGFVHHDIYLAHETGPRHPECPQRLVAILDKLKQSGTLDRLTQIEPAAADEKWITAVHSPEYVQRIKAQCRRGSGYVDSPDVPVCGRSYEAATFAVGGVLAAIDAVMEGTTSNAFCAVRPPGHHALKDQAMGFCLFNNVAIAARYIQRKHKLSKVLIVDWDVHHGNGTQDIFYDDPTVFYFGIHQYPFYPGSGAAGEKGIGEGLGFTLNVPLPAGSDDRDYQEAFEKSLRPAAIEFDPDFVLISAGFDAHEDDLLGGMEVTAGGFAELTRVVDQIAQECCAGRLVSVLEGGYGLQGLAASVEAHLRVLMNP
jgi:acetoin utilization deacetylase AcuC-like enzyme